MRFAAGGCERMRCERPPRTASERASRLLSAASWILICATAHAEDALQLDGKRLMEAACTQCHGLHPVVTTRDGAPGWRDTVDKMVVAGAQLSAAEMDRLVDYLANAYGPGAGPMQTGVLPPDTALEAAAGARSDDIELPPGEGRDLVQAHCYRCHDLGRVVVNRRSEADWGRYVRNMLAQGGVAASADERARMVAYLAEHFGSSAD